MSQNRRLPAADLQSAAKMGGAALRFSKWRIVPRHRHLAMACVFLVQIQHGSAMAADNKPSASNRPAINGNRWEENWSVLGHPGVNPQPFDSLKYIRLFADNPESYVSTGLTVRKTFESNDAPALATFTSNPSDAFWSQRFQVHFDVRLSENWQIFTQFEDVRAFDKTFIGPADANELDLRLAFLGYSQQSDVGTFKARVGRQDFDFDLQRFLSSREGPNIRQSFDAVWAAWELADWEFQGLVSQPVAYRNDRPFDDRSTSATRFSGVRVERHLSESTQLTGYYALYQREAAFYQSAFGNEERHILDMRCAGSYLGFDWDIEAMGQLGKVVTADVKAWAFGARAGYTFSEQRWPTRLGLQFDIASGDGDANDGEIGTFNPLFPNGSYFTSAGYTGYVNLIHLKPSLTINPADALTITGGLGLVWRQNTQDAIYTQPSIPIAGTAAGGDSWTGAYVQLRADYVFNPNLTGALEFVHYDVGSTLRAAGGRDSQYFRAELKFAW